MGGRSALVPCALAALAVACTPSSALLVDLRTDWVPGEEFAGARVELLAQPSATGVTRLATETLAPRGSTFLGGRRVAEWSDLAPGDHGLRVTLFDREGTVRARRFAVVSVHGRTLITVDVTRNCADVTCPASGGDPALTECVGARCVDPRCARETPASCGPPACTTSAECATAACADGACTDGACFAAAHDERCAAAEWCSPDEGCLSRTDLDAGSVGADGGALVDAARIDAGIDAFDPDAGCGVRPDPRGDGSLRLSSGLYCPSSGVVSAPYACVEGTARIDVGAGEDLTLEMRGAAASVIGGAGVHPTGPGAVLHVTTASTAPIYVALDLHDAPLEVQVVAGTATVTIVARGANTLTVRASSVRTIYVSTEGTYVQGSPFFCTMGCTSGGAYVAPPACAP